MAITYVGGQVGGRVDAAAALAVAFALTGGTDAAPLTDDVVIVCVVVGSTAGNPAVAITTPAGYTALGQLSESASTHDISLDVSYKRMGGTPDTTVTVPGTTSNNWGEAYTVQVFRGVDATTPLDVAPVAASATGSRRANPGPITPITAGAWIVICGGGSAAAGAGVYPAPTNYTTNFLSAIGNDANVAIVGSGYRTWTSGTEDPVAYTAGLSSGNSWGAYTIALRPSGGAPAAVATAQPYVWGPL